MTFGERLRFIRELKGITQLETSKIIGVTRQGYGNYENNITEPSFEVLIKLSELFQISIDYLITGKEYNSDFQNVIDKLEKSEKLLAKFKELSRQIE